MKYFGAIVLAGIIRQIFFRHLLMRGEQFGFPLREAESLALERRASRRGAI